MSLKRGIILSMVAMVPDMLRIGALSTVFSFEAGIALNLHDFDI
jgi:hypothetical protein